jgi:malonyl CoA-acyl carrier protein transacylase
MTQQSSKSNNIYFINETVECAHDIFNAHLVASGKAKNLQEASQQPRQLVCNCPKCSIKH